MEDALLIPVVPSPSVLTDTGGRRLGPLTQSEQGLASRTSRPTGVENGNASDGDAFGRTERISADDMRVKVRASVARFAELAG